MTELMSCLEDFNGVTGRESIRGDECATTVATSSSSLSTVVVVGDAARSNMLVGKLTELLSDREDFNGVTSRKFVHGDEFATAVALSSSSFSTVM